MRNLFYILTLSMLTVAFACNNNPNTATNNNQTVVDSTAKGIFKFDTTVFNFGTILEGEQVSTVFNYYNIGNADITISKIETSCGCTVPEYDKIPVKPQQQGSIRVRFDSNGKSGTQYKTIRIFSNSKESIFELVITGEVKNEL